MPDGAEIVHCRHTTDAGLAEKVVHHVLHDYQYEEGHEWFQGDPAYFAHVISSVVNSIDGLIDAGESIVTNDVAGHIAGILANGARPVGAPPTVVIHNSGSGNVTINFAPKPEDVASYKASNLLPENGSYIDWVCLNRDLKSWGVTNLGTDQVKKWKKQETIEALRREGIKFEATSRGHQGNRVNRRGVFNWKFSDPQKALTVAPSAHGEIEDTATDRVEDDAAPPQQRRMH